MLLNIHIKNTQDRINTDVGPLKQVTVSYCNVPLNSEQKAIINSSTQSQTVNLGSNGKQELRYHHTSTVRVNWKKFNLVASQACPLEVAAGPEESLL